MKKRVCLYYSIIIFSCFIVSANAQQEKVINKQDQAWVSINNTVRLSNHWGFIADAHERGNNFFADPSFHFLRAGVDYWLKDNITFVLGYGHMWVAPTTPGWTTVQNENRVYQQGQIISKLGTTSMMQRLRNEQRWQDIIVNDKRTGDKKFTDRIRYLLSFTIPVFKNPYYPAAVISDELCIQFGKEVVYNTFEQNRVFIGIKQKLTRDLSFDLGYMLVTQQKASGYVYDENHTFRWFFYYQPDLRKKKNN